MTQQVFQISQRNLAANTVVIPQIYPRSLSPLDATSLYESNSFADKEIKLKLKTKRKDIKEQLGKGKIASLTVFYVRFFMGMSTPGSR